MFYLVEIGNIFKGEEKIFYMILLFLLFFVRENIDIY